MTEPQPPQTSDGEQNQAPPPRKVTLYLVRHGQTHFNIEKRLPGQLPGVALTDEGRNQAKALGVAVREMPLTAIITSPLERARETALLVRGERDVPLREDPRLMDTDVGPWSGQVIDELSKADPRWNAFVRKPTQPPQGIEGFYQVMQRVSAAADDARHNPDLGDYVMLVAHADVVKLIICHYLRLPIEGTPWLHIPNASLTALSFEGDRDPQVVALNWLPSPSWLRPAPPSENATVANSQVSSIDTLPERGQG